MVKVYHNEEFLDAGRKGVTIKPEDCTHVADVDTDDLNVAYQLTNNIEDSWCDNKGVTISEVVRQLGGARSTSMGDVMFHDGKWYMVASIGFTLMADFSI